MRLTRIMPSLCYLREHLSYNSVTGTITLKSTGRVLNANVSHGYLAVCFSGYNLRAHRVAYLLHTATLPAGLDIDHIDGDKANNRAANLRAVTRSTNMRNVKRRVDNTSDHTGVSPLTVRVGQKVYNYWKVQWATNTDSKRSKSFPFNDTGLAMATVFRDGVERAIGGYTDRHKTAA
jgi:hypothetical protein